MSWKYRSDEMDPTLGGGLDLGTLRPPASLCHTGGQAAQIAADGVNSTPVVTEIYVAAVIVPFTCTVTGISVFNGSDVTDKVKVGLFNSAGVLLRTSAAAGTQCANADTYQNVPFALDGANAAATTIVLPTGTYYIGCIYNGTTSRFNAHGVGCFPGGKITGAVFATAFNTTSLTITPPTAFTAASLPPIASLY
jgi:hypothetical protein